MSIEAPAFTSLDANPREPRSWDEATVLALIKNDPKVVTDYVAQHRNEDRPQHALTGFENGLDYSRCGEASASSKTQLCDTDPEQLRAALVARARQLRSTANAMGLDIADAPALSKLKALHDDPEHLSDLELGIGLEVFSTEADTCGGFWSRPLTAGSVHSALYHPETREGHMEFAVPLLHNQITGWSTPVPADTKPAGVLTAEETWHIFGPEQQVTVEDWDAYWLSKDAEHDGVRDSCIDNPDSAAYEAMQGMGPARFVDGIEGAAWQRFTYMDANSDGMLTQEEFVARTQLRSQARALETKGTKPARTPAEALTRDQKLIGDH